MRLIDTNIVLRLLIADSPVDLARAREIVAEGDCFLPTVVFFEVVYALEYHYQFTKQDLIGLEDTLKVKELTIEDSELNIEALRLYVNSNLDFVGCWLLLKAKTSGLKLETLDRKLQKAYEKEAHFNP